MRVMIAGADYGTLSRLKSYLTKLGHVASIASNGAECKSGLCEFAPDLVVMELDIFWSGYEGVMSALLEDSHMNDVPIVFYTEAHKELRLEPYPRVIARIEHSFHPKDLSRLRDLLDNLELARVVNALAPQVNGEWTTTCPSLTT